MQPVHPRHRISTLLLRPANAQNPPQLPLQLLHPPPLPTGRRIPLLLPTIPLAATASATSSLSTRFPRRRSDSPVRLVAGHFGALGALEGAEAHDLLQLLRLIVGGGGGAGHDGRFGWEWLVGDGLRASRGQEGGSGKAYGWRRRRCLFSKAFDAVNLVYVLVQWQLVGLLGGGERLQTQLSICRGLLRELPHATGYLLGRVELLPVLSFFRIDSFQLSLLWQSSVANNASNACKYRRPHLLYDRRFATAKQRLMRSDGSSGPRHSLRRLWQAQAKAVSMLCALPLRRLLKGEHTLYIMRQRDLPKQRGNYQ